jgi:hypothetical protein
MTRAYRDSAIFVPARLPANKVIANFKHPVGPI